VQYLPYRSIVEAAVARHNIDDRAMRCLATVEGVLDFIHQRQAMPASIGLPPGAWVAKMKPAVGSEMMPGLRPNWAGQLLLPLGIGAMVGSEALTILQCPSRLPWMSRRDCVAMYSGVLGLPDLRSQALVPGRIELHSAVQTRLHSLCQSDDRLSESK
jgi:hypothetical protein